MEASRATEQPRSNSSDHGTEEISIYFKIVKTIASRLKRSDTIDNVKKYLHEKEGISENLQEFFFAGNRLSDSERLVDCGIHDNSTIKLILKHVVPMKLFVKILSSQKTIIVEARPQETAQDIKLIIQAKEGIQSDAFSLFYDGKLLEDDRTLASLNMKNESTIYLIFSAKDELTIFVKAPSEGMVKLRVKNLFTVGDIKAIVWSMIGVSYTDHHLFYSRKRLEDCKTLSSYNIIEESILRILPHSFQIFVKPWSGKTLTIDVSPFDTIEVVKSKVFNKLKIAGKYQSLLFAGKRLEDFRDLASYEIGRNSTLMMVLEPSAGVRKMSLNDIGVSRDNISILKAEIEKAIGVPVMKVLYKQVPLDDEHLPYFSGLSGEEKLLVFF